MTSNESNKSEQIFKKIDQKIDEDATIHAEIKEYIESLRSSWNNDNKDEKYKKLNRYKSFIEIEGLQQRWWETYTNIKYYLKELALKDMRNDEKIERDFYEWLKICVNSQKEINYDFYFERNKLDKEEQVKEILFINNGKGNLRDIFKNRNGRIHDKWQIRLRTISSWFLKRYDRHTAKKILDIIPKNISDRATLFLPRLLVAIFIGFLPLVFSRDAWELPIELGLYQVIAISVMFVFFFFLYLIYECYNITRDNKIAIKRGIRIGRHGLKISLISSLIIVCSMSNHFVQDMTGGRSVLGHVIFLENISFFASVPLLVGIFIQIFWEEKTITEPL